MQLIHVSESGPGESDWMKKKSVHTYRRWMWKRLRDRSVATHNEIGLIVSDFHKIVSVLREEGLIKRNVSRYDFYIIRICSRKRIHPREPTRNWGGTGAQDMIGTIEREN